MKQKIRFFSITLIAVGLFTLSASEAKAQVYVGPHASIIDVRWATFGLGARLGAVLGRSGGMTYALEGVAEYLFPPCDVVECDAVSFQGNLLVRRRMVSSAEAYAGVGITYQDFSLESDDAAFDGNDIGLNLIVGTQSGQPGAIRPFLEVRATFMDELQNQFGASFGLRVPVG